MAGKYTGARQDVLDLAQWIAMIIPTDDTATEEDKEFRKETLEIIKETKEAIDASVKAGILDKKAVKMDNIPYVRRLRQLTCEVCDVPIFGAHNKKYCDECRIKSDNAKYQEANANRAKQRAIAKAKKEAVLAQEAANDDIRRTYISEVGGEITQNET